MNWKGEEIKLIMIGLVAGVNITEKGHSTV